MRACYDKTVKAAPKFVQTVLAFISEAYYLRRLEYF